MVSKYANNKSIEERHKFWISNDGNRRCCTCERFKPPSEYHKDKSGVLGLSYSCKECANARSRKHHAKRMVSDPDYKAAKKNSYIKSAWGMTQAQYNELLKSQNYCCAICGTDKPKGGWHLDHDHVTGKVRAFLCNPCNRGIGYLQDNKEILVNAVKYLEKHDSSVDAIKEGIGQ